MNKRTLLAMIARASREKNLLHRLALLREIGEQIERSEPNLTRIEMIDVEMAYEREASGLSITPAWLIHQVGKLTKIVAFKEGVSMR